MYQTRREPIVGKDTGSGNGSFGFGGRGVTVLCANASASAGQRALADQLTPMIKAVELPALQREVLAVRAAEPLIDYVQALVEATRRDAAFQHGLSPRAGLALLAAARAWAWLDGREMVLPDDVQAVLPAVARHRLRATQGTGTARAEDITALLHAVPIP